MELKQPLVSIGIPTYNRPDGLQQIIECIRNQTYSNLEIIVSDNCSPGGAVETLMAQVTKDDPRVRYFRQSENVGAFVNSEFVLELASGEYFVWAADDDLCENDFIEKIVGVMEQDSDITLCACDVKIIDEHDNFLEEEYLTSIRPNADWKQIKKLFYRYPTSNIFFSIFGVYRTEAVKRCNVRISRGWKGLATNGEVPFLAQLANAGKIVAIDSVLKVYRKHSDSLYHRELGKIPTFDAFMMRLVIRAKLLKLIWISKDSLLQKLSLFIEVIKSGFAGINIKNTVIALIPRPVRKILKNYANKMSHLRR